MHVSGDDVVIRNDAEHIAIFVVVAFFQSGVVVTLLRTRGCEITFCLRSELPTPQKIVNTKPDGLVSDRFDFDDGFTKCWMRSPSATFSPPPPWKQTSISYPRMRSVRCSRRFFSYSSRSKPRTTATLQARILHALNS